MNKIHIMSEILANKIAAGEVIEKCASIIKELVENSIDASATEIFIHLLEGGLKEIKVIDNGDGMNKEDAVLAFSRHATSKIIKDDDLFFIDTLGFRGEALPSIASVSNVVLKTCQNDVGTLVHIKGGKLIETSNTDSKKGTSITVTDLFYNTPARLKYLKSEQTELSNCVNFIEKLSFAYPNIRFTLTNNEKTIFQTSGSNNLLKTIHEVYGLNISSKMLEIKASTDDYDVYGFVCKPEILKSNRNHMTTIVNGRIVRNNDLNRAINDAYYTYKPDIKYPVVVLKIDTDPTLIDVNIHPTKQDIKLSKLNELCELVTSTIKKQLYNNLLIPNAIKNEEVKVNDYEVPIISSYQVKEESESYSLDDEAEQKSFDFSYNDSNVMEISEPSENEEIKRLVLYPVGVVHGTYIIAQNEEGMYLIDQHAAQERINYEKYLKALREKDLTTISPLFPINIELNTSDYLALIKQQDFLASIGFQIEEFGVNTITIKAHPTWLKEGYEEESIHMILDLVIKNGSSFDVVKFNENVAITLACKMSIKANMRISEDNIEQLLKDLVQTDNPYNCPHGRPTIIKYTINDLERMFKRVMN